MENNKNLVSFGVSPELIQPIVEKEIKAAVTAMLGGSEKIVDGVVHNILYQKVNKESGKPDSYNAVTMIEYLFTGEIKKAITEEVKKQLAEASGTIKQSIIKSLRSEKGSNRFADALLDAFLGTLSSAWRTKVLVEIDTPKD